MMRVQPNENCNLNVLVTSISAKTPLLREVRKALQKISRTGQLSGGDLNPDCPGRYFVDDFWQMPATEDLTIEALLDGCRQRGIQAIIPSRDGELRFFATYREILLAAGIKVMVSPLSAIENCLDKLAFAERISQEMPELATPTATDLETLPGAEFAVKERYGAGSREILLEASRQQAEAWAAGLKEPIFQPQLNGQELSIDVFLTQKGQAKGALVRSRDMIHSGEAKITTTIHEPKLELLCCRLAEQLKLIGHVVFQGIRDGQGKFRLFECNARFGGASTLAIAAGLDSFYWFLLECRGGDLAEHPYQRSQQEMRQVRHATDLLIKLSTHSQLQPEIKLNQP